VTLVVREVPNLNSLRTGIPNPTINEQNPNAKNSNRVQANAKQHRGREREWYTEDDDGGGGRGNGTGCWAFELPREGMGVEVQGRRRGAESGATGQDRRRW